MTENNRSTESTTPATEELQSAASPFPVTREMTSLDEAVLLMITNPGMFDETPVHAPDPVRAEIVDPTIRLEADNLPAAMLFVLYGTPSFMLIAITAETAPSLIANALLRLGVSRFDILGPILMALGDQGRLAELTALANNRRQQLSSEQLAPLTSADVHETLMEVAKLVITSDEIKNLVTGIALLAVGQGLADYISRLAMNDALDISEPDTDTPPTA